MSRERFAGKVMAVTGAAQGIGREVALRAAGEGAVVALIDRSDLIHEVAAEITAQGGLAHAITADLESWEGADKAIATALEPAGRIEIGVRPEYVVLDPPGAQGGMPVTVQAVEDIGREKIVRAELEGRPLALLIGEDDTVPAEPRVRFDPAGVNVYADDWRVG